MAAGSSFTLYACQGLYLGPMKVEAFARVFISLPEAPATRVQTYTDKQWERIHFILQEQQVMALFAQVSMAAPGVDSPSSS